MTGFQRGGMFGWLLVLLLVVAFALQLVRIVPHYLDHRTLTRVVADMVADEQYALGTSVQFRRALTQRLQRNNIRSIDLDTAVRIEQRATGLRVDIFYEAREPLIGNMVLLLVFEERFDSALH